MYIHVYVYKIRLLLFYQLTDEQITDYLEKHDECRHQMSMFFQLRIALSPAIEAIILLDRCLWLLEQVVIVLAHISTLNIPQWTVLELQNNHVLDQ